MISPSGFNATAMANWSQYLALRFQATNWPSIAFKNSASGELMAPSVFQRQS